MIHEICKVLGEEFCLVDQSSYLLDMDSISTQAHQIKNPAHEVGLNQHYSAPRVLHAKWPEASAR